MDDPDAIASMVERSIKNSTERRKLGFFSCGTGNPIDDCWRCDPNWHKNRKRLADCGIGFGRNAIGGRDGRFYVVTDPSDDDPVNPRPGTLRHAVIQTEPLWIVFKRDMVIQLKQELIMNSFKTIDGRGSNVHIANGACITIQFITNVIIHGLHIHDCKPTGNALVRSSPTHYGLRSMADGDAISIFGSSHIWVDHNSLSHCADGLVDAVMGSTAITISNNHFAHHNEVMLLGHSDSYVRDKQMQVTIAYNHFGAGLMQRMPRYFIIRPLISMAFNFLAILIYQDKYRLINDFTKIHYVKSARLLARSMETQVVCQEAIHGRETEFFLLHIVWDNFVNFFLFKIVFQYSDNSMKTADVDMGISMW